MDERYRIIQALKDYLVYFNEIGEQRFLMQRLSGVEVQREAAENGNTLALAEVRRELGDCKRCPIWESRTHIVFGEGDSSADLMFVGEAPGRDEDREGMPFVGQAGRVLTQLIEAIGLTRESVYIANVLKCRPPGNRTPKPEEIEQCLPFLMKQVDVIRPRIICALGAVAAQTLLGKRLSITRLRGEFVPWKEGIELFLTFHPAYLLRNPGEKRKAMQDFLKLKERLESGR